MGVLTDAIEYVLPRPTAFHRAVWKATSSSPGAWAFAKTAHHIDRYLLRVSKGKLSAPGVFAGLPPVLVTMTGARSGLRRTVPLIGIPVDGDIALIGTRFGQPGTPAWYFNLKKTPQVEVEFGGRRAAAVAREVEAGPERDAIWARGCEVYAGYAAYARRIRDREIHVMVLSAPS